MVRQGWYFMAAALAAGLFANLIAYRSEVVDWLVHIRCDDVRLWLEALSGVFTLAAAAPTVYYIRKQISKTEQHQRTAFTIQLRRERILAETAITFAKDGDVMIRDAYNKLAEFSSRPADYELVRDFLKGEIVAKFETEIAVPKMAGKIVAKKIDRALTGVADEAKYVPNHVATYFSEMRIQAKAFLDFVDTTTKPS